MPPWAVGPALRRREHRKDDAFDHVDRVAAGPALDPAMISPSATPATVGWMPESTPAPGEDPERDECATIQPASRAVISHPKTEDGPETASTSGAAAVLVKNAAMIRIGDRSFDHRESEQQYPMREGSPLPTMASTPSANAMSVSRWDRIRRPGRPSQRSPGRRRREPPLANRGDRRNERLPARVQFPWVSSA